MSDNAADTHEAPSFAEIRKTLHLVGEQVRGLVAEREEQAKESDRRLKETERLQKETERLQRETALQMQETDRRMQETDRQMQETDRRLKKAEGLFTTQWGKLLESLVEGDLVPLLKDRGIDVNTTYQRRTGRRNGEHVEFDIVATNGADTVVVEVKTTLRPEDVREFLTKLSFFAEWFQDHRRDRILGAVAYLKSDESVTRHAERQGLFVIRATGSSASILNSPDFKPRAFSCVS